MAEWISTSSQSQWSSSSWNYRVTLCLHRFLPVWNNPRYLYPHRLVLVRLTLELIPWKISEHLPVFLRISNTCYCIYSIYKETKWISSTRWADSIWDLSFDINLFWSATNLSPGPLMLRGLRSVKEKSVGSDRWSQESSWGIFIS